MAGAERNWAGNLTYSAPVLHPGSVEELQEAVARAEHVHALGTRHSFSPCADSEGVIVALDRIGPDLVVDEAAGTATVGAAVRLGDLGRALDDKALAFANLPSLPHISLGGAIATATHGSGDDRGMLATMVRGLDVVGADGVLRHIEGDDLAAWTMAHGALGVVTRVTIATEPAYVVRQDPFEAMTWAALDEHLDEVFAAGYSVSLFTRWAAEGPHGALVKSRGDTEVAQLVGARPSPRDPAEIRTGTKDTPVRSPGPWWDRLPHFRMASTPSVGAGEELQSEYFVPRASARAAIAALRSMGADIDPALHGSELRTVAADDHWLSPAHGVDVLAIGFTWRDLPELVFPLLPRIEAHLLPLGARPHWAKLFDARELRLRDHYARWNDFRDLRDEVDPERTFGNPFLAEVLGP